MKPTEDPWQRKAHENAKRLETEVSHLSELVIPIRQNLPIITRYQDFWNSVRQVSDLFRELKPLAQADRDRLWAQFSDLCGEVKESQKSGYGTLESLSKGHLDEITKVLELANLPAGRSNSDLSILLEHGYSLKKAAELLGRYKHEMIAQHKKRIFERIQQIRKTHDAAWESFATEKTRQQAGLAVGLRLNLEKNYERLRKAAAARDHFRGIADELRGKIATAWNEEWRADAIRRISETERRIRDVDEGIRKLETWIKEDERTFRGK